MTLDPHLLTTNLDLLEQIEKATLRLVVQAIDNFRGEMAYIFSREQDLAQDISEDLTREALDRMVHLPSRLDYSGKWIIRGQDISSFLTSL